MNHYAYLDLCFFEKCNLTCDYCRTSNKGMKGGISPELFTETVNSFLVHSQATVFKVSGYGEVSLWSVLPKAMKVFTKSFPTLQVMTNGTMREDKLNVLSEIENLIFCLTLDGHTLETNRYRNQGKEHLHQKMLHFAHGVIKRGKKLEMNCVLTATNIENFPELLLYIRDNLPGVMVMPFPFRPFVGLQSNVKPANINQVKATAEQIFSQYDEFSMLLPSRLYMERLFEFMLHGHRTMPCFVPAFNYGVGPKLKPLACACLGHTKPSDDLSNVLKVTNNIHRISKLIDTSSRRKMLLAKGYVDERCQTCFTHYEIINLFLEGSVGWEEISRIPSFNQPGSRLVLEKVKEENSLGSESRL